MAIEPDDVAEYSRQSYWEGRYAKEDHHEWFLSVHQASVKALCDELVTVFNQRETLCVLHPGEFSGASSVLRVLHLGTGSSSLCMDLYEAVCERQLPFTLEQVAMDYASNVIEKMREKYPPEVLPKTQWVVGDACRLEEFSAMGPFDAVIEKGVMDALEADKGNTKLEEDVRAMLRGVDGLLKHAKGYGEFLQITFAPPHLRRYTKGSSFVWGDQVRHALLGESDMYRLFVYTVMR